MNRLELVAQVFTNALVRTRHEESRRESEERLALAADSAEAGLWTLDYGTGVFWATEQARTIFGYTPDEDITMDRFRESVQPDDWDRVLGAIERSRAGEPLDVEYRITPPGTGRVRWIHSRGRSARDPAGRVERLTGISFDVTERKTAEAESRSRLEFETLIADLSSRFINLPASDVDHEIEDALRRVCEPLGIDLAVLWQWSAAAREVIAPTHAYPSQGPMALPEPLRQEQYPWYARQMWAGRQVAISSLEELPEEASVDRESSRLVGVKSTLCLPLSVGGEPPVGCVGFNALLEPRDWPDSVVTRLQLVAQVFTNALARMRYEKSLRESEARLAAGADLAGLAFYEVDFGGSAVFLDDRFRDVCGVPPERQEGLQALEFWMEHLHPDDRQRVLDLRQELHDGKLERITVEYRYRHPALGEKWIHHMARVATPRRERTARSRRSASSATSRRDGSARRPCGSRTRRSSG